MNRLLLIAALAAFPFASSVSAEVAPRQKPAARVMADNSAPAVTASATQQMSGGQARSSLDGQAAAETLAVRPRSVRVILPSPYAR